MNTLDILKYGHQTVLNSLDPVPQSEWQEPGVCGYWSVKDIVAHLASYELMLYEILAGLVGEEIPSPTLERMATQRSEFNDSEVARRQEMTPEAVLAEYDEAHEKVMEYAARLPADKFRQNGILPWYGDEYDLDDFLVYTFYGHKREHMAQVDHFRDSLSSGE
jgi:uncharacterized protein (TIGR03083 family)